MVDDIEDLDLLELFRAYSVIHGCFGTSTKLIRSVGSYIKNCPIISRNRAVKTIR